MTCLTSKKYSQPDMIWPSDDPLDWATYISYDLLWSNNNSLKLDFLSSFTWKEKEWYFKGLCNHFIYYFWNKQIYQLICDFLYLFAPTTYSFCFHWLPSYCYRISVNCSWLQLIQRLFRWSSYNFLNEFMDVALFILLGTEFHLAITHTLQKTI